MKRKILRNLLIIILVTIAAAVAVFVVIKIQSNNQNNTEVQDTADTTAPELQLPIKKITTLQPRTSFLVYSNEDVTAVNKDKYQLHYINDTAGGLKVYVLEVFNTALGTATPTIQIQDANGNITEVKPEIVRENFSFPLGLKDVPEFDPYIYVDGEDLSANVKKGVKLYTTYEPTDLVDLNIDKLLYTNSPGIKLRTEAAEALAVMLRNLKKDTGKDVVIASGYRSYNVQFRTYVEWVRQLGLEEADIISARPGYSEHQLGTAVDFMSADSGFDFTEAFADTHAGQWLATNAHEYGFVLSYPKDKIEETGYSYEPWHYRYIGLDLAQEYKESGLVLNKFLSQ
jgi:LAS superfamily LD-carboxypeptidase LdcB